MRATLAFVVSIVMAACSGADRPAPMTHHPVGAAPIVRGTVKIAPAGMCGGAAPPPEYRPPEPAPAAGVKLLVRPGKENSDAAPVAEVTTGADGTFMAPVDPGTYCVVFADKRTAPGGAPDPNTDAACLVQQWKTCDAIAEVPTGAPADIVHYTPCFGPCYHGPLPP